MSAASRRLVGAALVAVGVLLACRDDPLAPGQGGGVISIRIARGGTAVGPQPAPAATIPFSAVRVRVQHTAASYDQAKNLTQNGDVWEGSFTQVPEGRVQVVVEALESGAISGYYSTAVTIVEDRENPVNATLVDMQPQFSAGLPAGTFNFTVPITWASIARADSYQVDIGGPSATPDTTVTSNGLNLRATGTGAITVRLRSLVGFGTTTPPAAGRWSSTYSVSVNADTLVNGTSGQATLVAPDGTLRGLNIPSGGAADWFKFGACRSDGVRVSTRAAVLSPPSGLNTILRLVTPAGDTLATNDDDGTTTDSRIDWVDSVGINVDGEHRIIVGSADGSVGHYELVVDTIQGPKNNGDGTCVPAATQWAFTQEPSGIAAGVAITPAVRVEAQDGSGSVATDFTGDVTLALQNDPTGGAAALLGTVTVAAVSGVATFDDISVDTVGTGYTLRAFGGGLTDAVSGTFDVTPGAADSIVIQEGQGQSAPVLTVVPIDPTVEIIDQFGNSVPGVPVIFIPSGDGQVSSDTTPTNIDGWSSVTWTLGSTVGANSDTLTVLVADVDTVLFVASATAGAPAGIVFFTQPDFVPSGSTLPQIDVHIVDGFNNTVPGATDAVTISLTPDPDGGPSQLTGTLTVNASGGIARFSDLFLEMQGNWHADPLRTHMLAASAGALGVDTSQAFRLGPGGWTTTWTGGASSTDWHDAGNWSGGYVPGDTDVVVIPADVSPQPALTAATSVNSLWMDDGATLATSTFDLTIAGDVRAGIINPQGWVTVTGSAGVSGSISKLRVIGNVGTGGRVTTDSIDVAAGTFTINSHYVGASDFQTSGTGVLAMKDPTDTLQVSRDPSFGAGSVVFDGSDEFGLLVDGHLFFAGNFSARCGAFQAAGNHTTHLGATGVDTQTVSLACPNASPFNNLTMPNAPTIVLLSDIRIDGTLISPGTGLPFIVGGTISVEGVDIDGLRLDGAAIRIGQGTITRFDNVQFVNFDAGQRQLTVVRPGGTFTFNGLQFSQNNPGSDIYISAEDQNPADGDVLTIELVNANPLTAEGTSGEEELGGAVINWAEPAALIQFTSTDTTLTSVADSYAPGITIEDQFANPLPRAAVIWSSHDPGVADVTSDGVVTAQTTGLAWIRAVSPVNPAIADSIAVTVTNEPASLELDRTLDTLFTLAAQLQYNATVRNARGDVIATLPEWALSDSGVATIDATGLATSVAVGQTLIIAQAGVAPLVADTATLVVRDTLLPDLVPLSVSGPTQVNAGDTVTVSIQVQNQGNASSGSSSYAVYLSTDATIESTDLVLTKAGVSVIPVLDPGQTSTVFPDVGIPAVPDGAYVFGVILDTANTVAELDETNNALASAETVQIGQIPASVTVTPTGATVTTVGATQAFTAEVRDAGGTLIPSALVEWSSLNPNVSTVDPSSGVATAVASGQVTIAATAGGVTGYALLTVAAPGDVPVSYWTSPATPTGNSLLAVWAPAPDNAWAVGSGGTAIRYNGSGWAGVLTGINTTLNDVWGSASDDVYAVGSSARVIHYDGIAWDTIPTFASPASLVFSAIWGSSPNDIFAAGGNQIYHYDGSSWSPQATLPTNTFDLWGWSANDVWAVGLGGQIYRYDGSSWGAATSPTSSELQGVWGTGPNDVYVVGNSGLVFHWDGGGWTQQATGVDTFFWYYKDAWGTSASEVYFVAANFAVTDDGIVVTYDGADWTTVVNNTGADLFGVSGISTGAVWAVGGAGKILRGVRASVTVTPSGPTLTAFGQTVQLSAQMTDVDGAVVSGVPFTWSSDDVAVASVDAAGLVTSVGGGVATITATAPGGAFGTATVTVDVPIASIEVDPIGATLSSVGAQQTFTANMFDSFGNPNVDSAATWTSLNPNVATVDPSTGVATAVASGQVTIAATAGGVTSYATLTVFFTSGTPIPATLWRQEASGTGNTLNAVWTASPTAAFAVGASGTAVRFNGTGWAGQLTGVTSVLYDVWGTSTTDVYAVGSSGRLLHYNGSVWDTLPRFSTSASLFSIWGASPDDIFVTAGSQVYHWDGSAWVSQLTAAGTMYSLWGTSAVDVWAVGASGLIYRYNGTNWTQQFSPTGNLIRSVWGTDFNDVYVVTEDTTAYQWDGNVWTPVLPGKSTVTFHSFPDYESIWGTASAEIFVASGSVFDHGFVRRFNGSTWGTAVDDDAASLFDVHGISSSSVFVVGGAGRIYRGVRAQVAVSPGSTTLNSLGETVQLTATTTESGNPVSGVTYTWSSSDSSVVVPDANGLVTAIGNGTATITATAPGGASGSATVTVAQAIASLVVTPNGTSISGVSSTQQFGAEAHDANDSLIMSPTVIWTSLNSNVATIDGNGLATAVANGQATIAATVDTLIAYGLLSVEVTSAPVNLWTEWTFTNQNFRSIWGIGDNEVYTAGIAGSILRYDGTTWDSLRVDFPANYLSIWGSQSNDIVIGGGGDVLLYDGATLTSNSGPGISDILGLWGSSPRDIHAVAQNGLTSRFDGAQWSTISSPGGSAVNDVWGFSDSNGYAVTASGELLSFDGTGWSSLGTYASGALNGIHGSAPSNVIAVGDGGLVLRFNGTVWDTLPSPGAVSLNGVWSQSPNDVYAVGTSGKVYHYDGTSWADIGTGIGNELFDVWSTSSGRVFVGGGGWVVLEGYRGATVTVTPSAETIATISGTAQLTVEARDAASVLITDSIAYTWSSSDSSVAVPDASGLVTAIANGAATITAAAPGGASGQATITVAAVPATAVWQGGDGGGASDWSNPSNWIPAGVPTSTDTVYVPATSDQPLLTANVTVGALTIAGGGDLNTNGFTIIVNGSVDAGNTISGTGVLLMAGLGGTLQGSVSNLAVQAPVTLVGRTVVGGYLTLEDTLDINGQVLTVGGKFAVPLGTPGVLLMQQAADTVVVSGDADFVSTPNTTGALTAGVLLVGGNFYQNYNVSPANFAASGTHKVVLNGAGVQTLQMNGGAAEAHFQELEIANTSGDSVIILGGNVYVLGDLTVSTSVTVVGEGSVTVEGDVSTVAGSDVRPAELSIGGPLGTTAVDGTFAPGLTTFNGPGPALQPIQVGLDYQSVTANGPVAPVGALVLTGNLTMNPGVGRLTLAGPSSVDGDVTLNGDTLDINGQVLTVGGKFAVPLQAPGILLMQQAADTVAVSGDADFLGALNTTGTLTAGVLLVGGNFYQNYNVSPANFAASGTHKVVLNGAGVQTLQMNGGAAEAHFQELEIANTSGDSVIILGGNVYVLGDLTVVGPTSLSGAGSVIVEGTSRFPAETQHRVALGAMTTGGVDVQNLTVDNTPLTIGGGTITAFDGVEFVNFPNTATQLAINRPSGNFTFTNLMFGGLVGGDPGFYIGATDTDTGDGQTLTIDLDGATPEDGASFTATNGAVVNWNAGSGFGSASQLLFSIQPVGTTGGATLDAVEVTVQDSATNTVTSFAGDISIAIGNNPSGGTLTGTTPVAAVNGVASFNDLSIDKSGTGYTLVASSSGVTDATSGQFTIVVGSAESLVLVSGNGQTGTPSTALPESLVVQVLDAGGNSVSGVNVTWTVTAGGGGISPVIVPSDASGLAKARWTLGSTGVDTATASSSGLVGSPVVFTALTPPVAPTLVAPSDGATDQNTRPTLSWTGSPGAIAYHLQVSLSPSFSTTVFDDTTITATARQVGPLLNSEPHYWRVRAKNTVGWSPYSATFSLTTHPAPTVETMSIRGSFTSPGSRPEGLAWDGTNLWMIDNLQNVFKMDTLGNVLAQFTAPGFPDYDLSWDGMGLWIGGGSLGSGKHMKVDTLGTKLDSLLVGHWALSGFEWDGKFFWISDYNSSLVYKHARDGTALLNFSVDVTKARPNTLSYDGLNLWIGSPGSFVNKYSTSGQLLSSLSVSALGITSTAAAVVAWDGESLWYAKTDQFTIYRLSVP